MLSCFVSLHVYIYLIKHIRAEILISATYFDDIVKYHISKFLPSVLYPVKI